MSFVFERGPFLLVQETISVITREQIQKCNCDIWITECIHEKEDFVEFAVLAFQSWEKKRG